MYRSLFVLAVVLLVVPALAQAENFSFLAQADPTETVLEIVKKVLDVVVQFIGDVLDEIVRAIKELLSGDGTSEA